MAKQKKREWIFTHIIKQLFIYNVFGILLLISLPGCASLSQPSHQNSEKIKKVNKGINYLLTLSKNKADIAIMVQSMNTGTILYQKNSDKLFIPASNQKLFTAYTALQTLGSEFKYKTQLLTDAANINDGILNGNLYMRFEGDPELEFKEVKKMVVSLSQQGIHTITGNFYIDSGYFDEQGIAPGTIESDIHYCYGAPVNAVIINHNCANVKILPARKIGHLAQLVSSQNVPLPIANNVITKLSNKACKLRLTENTEGKYSLTGCVNARSKAMGVSFALQNSKEYMMALMKTLFHERKIKIMAMTERSANALPLKVLASHESRPMKDLVYDMMKKSDNIIANALFKTLGANQFHQPGSWDNSSEAMKSTLNKNRIYISPSVKIIDGSGLSRENRISTSGILQILKSAYVNSTIRENFISSLPVSGINGTLKHRMNDIHMAGKVRAKTGTMKGVSALSGYIESTNHEIYAFSIIINSHMGWTGNHRILEDKICRFLSSI
ncbi:MAG: D-alanyl-D-alanine carboxypeptidase DacB [Legionellaceae bacterium]